MTTAYILKEHFQHILSALMPENRLALEISLCTGLRISDVLSLKTSQIKPRFSLREQKTGKKRVVSLPVDLRVRMHSIAGKVYVFEHRLSFEKHRTRQAVYKDIKRAAKLFRMPSDLCISCHSARKIYAVGAYKRTCSVSKVRELLSHSNEAVTMVYLMSEELTRRNYPQLCDL